jgi:hypothetical protein
LDALKEHLVKSLLGGQAFTSYKQALSDVNPININKKPNGVLHSIYEELEHMCIAQQDLLYYAFEEGWEPRPWPEGFWPQKGYEASTENWDKTVEEFLLDLKKKQ